MTDSQQKGQRVLEVGGTPLSGRSAVVTGASSGIGRSTARALAGAGARVGLAARRAERLEDLRDEIVQGGGEALALPTDIADYAQVEAMVRGAEETFGGIDILVNVAGIMLPAPIAEADPADWHTMIEVQLLGVMYAARAALPGMLQRNNGHIVNVSSTSGRTHQPLFSGYAASKHGVGAFTNILRKEVYPNRVRVTLFEPGPTETELGSHADPEVMRDFLEEMGDVEFLKAEDVAQGILWTLAQPNRVNVNEVLFRPTDQKDW